MDMKTRRKSDEETNYEKEKEGKYTTLLPSRPPSRPPYMHVVGLHH